MKKQEIEKCRKLIKACSSAFDRLGVWFTESGSRGFLMFSDDDGNGCCNISELSAVSYDEFWNRIVREYTVRRAADLVEEMPDTYAMMVTDFADSGDELAEMLGASDREIIETEIETFNIDVKP